MGGSEEVIRLYSLMLLYIFRVQGVCIPNVSLSSEYFHMVFLIQLVCLKAAGFAISRCIMSVVCRASVGLF